MDLYRIAMVYAALLFMVVFSYDASAYEGSHDCEKHPIYCQIINNVPTIKRAYAFQLSNVIYKKTKKYDLDPSLFTAILAQESKYDLGAKNCSTGVIDDMDKEVISFAILAHCKNETGRVPGDLEFMACVKEMPTNGKVKVCTDFGIGQIWHATAESYEFDLDKLTSDLEYSVEAAAIVLKDFKNMYSKKDPEWWTRYNASTPSKRQRYKKFVELYKDAD